MFFWRLVSGNFYNVSVYETSLHELLPKGSVSSDMLCCKLCSTQCTVNQMRLFMIGFASNDKTLINYMHVCWSVAYCECV